MSRVNSQANQAAFKTGKYLTVCLGHGSYGIAVSNITEIIRMHEITPIPKMPDYVRGVVNVRRRVIPIIDLRVKFHLDRVDQTDSSCIVVVRTPSLETSPSVGLLVDGLGEVLNVIPDDIEPAPASGVNLNSRYSLGIVRTKGAASTLLDIDRVIVDVAVNDPRQAA